MKMDMKIEKVWKTLLLPFSSLLIASAANAVEQVTFRDYDAVTKTFTNAVRECTLVTAETRTLGSGWYAVQGEVTIPEGNRLVVQGDAHLVLCDGATLRIPAADTGLAAILLSGKNSLTIYGQSLGSGSLEAVGGGVNLGDSRTDPGAGIGGDSNLSGGMVTINGGTVTARSGRKVLSDSIDSIVGFAGIGGNQATVTINGGTVLAQCLGGLGVGIGGNDARVAINGGVVTAQGVGNSQLGACDIGSYVAGCTVTIGGGSIDAFSIRGDIRISGGIFTIPIPDNWCADQFAPSGNADPATQGKYPHAVVPGWTVTIGSHPKTTAVWTSGNGVVSNAVEGSSFKVPDGSENVTVHFTAHSDYVLEGEATVALGTVTEDIVFGVGNEFAVPRGYCPLGDIPYLDWNGSQMTNAVLSKYDYALVTDATEEMTEGWYVVAQDIERDRIKVTGAVNLVLVDDRELSVSGTRDDVPGIDVSGSNRLTIYGQIKGTGQLTANGGERSAGIGGGAGGYVTINGGTVIAQSANAGAGIGGGSQAEGGIVAINGGTVTAMGGWGATGIGGGWGKGGGTATICGGAVTAKAGMQGESDVSGTVSISGGIFGMEPQDAWLAEKRMVVPNPDEATQADYPWAVVPSYTVTIGTLSHLTAAWTSGDGSVTNAVSGTSFGVPGGSENVKVIFTAHRGWELVGGSAVELGTVTADIDFGEESGYEVPTVRRAAVKYIDADGVEQAKSAGEFDVVTEETRFLTNGWYAVIEDVDIAAKTNITVQGDVHLILCDGASLTVTNAPMHCAAVSVGTNATLAIYGQTEGTGRLTTKGGAYGAGIGGGHTGDGCGAVVIHGGTITATGGTSSAGIGGCYKNDGGSVTITGGRIAATKKGISAVDIGNGSSAVSDCEVSISGGVFANPVETTWCAEGYAPATNPDPATAADYPYMVRPAYRVTIGDHPHMAAAWTCGDRSVTNEIEGVSFAVMPPGTNGVQVIFTAEPGWVLVGDAVVDVGEVAGDIAFGDDFRVPGVQREPVKYIDADGEERSRNGAEFDVVTTGTRFLTNGWYVVLDDVVIREKTNLSVLGDAHLILCDGASLTVTNVPNSAAAIAVGAGASLAVYGQTDGTGRLEARGGMYGAGIGGGSSVTVGSVAIHGGTVQAYGGSSAASIGSGLYGDGGSVTITGGRISATYGSTSVSVIGNGASVVSPCAVSISGGVFARTVQDAWCADHFGVFANTDPATAAAYPYAVLPSCMVTIGECPIHVTAAWTSGDGSATNAIESGSVVMPDGTPNVRVVFTAESGWELVGESVVNLGTVTGDITFGVGNDYKVPHAVPVGAIDYLDWDAVNETLTNATVAAGGWTLVTDATRTLNDGWYVVASDVAIPVGSNIVVNGSAHLILCDGASLSVTGGYDQAAIEVLSSGSVTNTLTIYGQTECTGRLTVQGGDRAAGIGSGFYGDFGAVTINGGTVTATGGWGCPAIGNGWWGQGGAVTINAGRVVAAGDMRRGNCAVSIRGGVFGMSIPDAWCAEHRGMFLNPESATSAEYPYAVLPAWKVTIGERQHMTVEWTSDDGQMTNVVEGTSFKVRLGERNVRVIFTADSDYALAGDAVVRVGTVNSDIVFGVGNDFKAPYAGIPYLDWDETNRVMTNAVSPVVCDVYSTSIRDLQDGHWYVVKGEHTIREYSGLRVSGDVHIILCDGSSLSIVLQKDPDGNLVTEPGIEVGEGSSLTVYGQVNGSGRLVAVGGDGGAAGIGGREGGACGAVTINGGEVSSAGGSDYSSGASGIGTGNGGYGGSVTINGGKVTASGNEYGAGIGDDYRGRNMTVIINGGTVTATGGADGASIKGDNVTINDGAIDVGNMGGVIAIFGGVFRTQPQVGWLAAARSVVPNMDLTTADTHPWRVVESAKVVSLDAPLGPFATAEEATNAMATAVFVPSEEIVSRILLRGVSPKRYSEKFGFGVTSKGEGAWYVEAALTDAAKAYLAETATKATLQIPVAEIAKYDDETIHGFWVQDCEPGFYYTLYCAAEVCSLPDKGTKCGPAMCLEDGKLMFNWVDKPSAATGFFTIGVSATKGE